KTLEVLQNESKAIFKGEVIAVQGDVRIKSDEMIVYYSSKDDKSKAAPAVTPPAASSVPPAGQGDMGAIKSIEVHGNVIIATPQESAKGDRGDYEVATRIVHLFGDNVVLTRDKNIMKGTALEYNMETGRSLLTRAEDSKTKTDDRVRMVIVPQEKPAEKPAVATGDKDNKTK
ncbi:MAG: LptA/OstA family protein, partial [Pseudomonadota bacterium]